MINNIYLITFLTIIMLFVLSIIGTKKQYGSISKNTYFSIQQTNWLKGISILTIVFSHYYPILGISNVGSFWLLGIMAFFGVAFFLFVSGYSAMYSRLNKEDYLKGYIKKRMVRLYLPFIIVFVFDIILLCICNQKITFQDFLKIPIMSLPGTLNWYLKVQFVLYIIFYILARIINNNSILVFTMFAICVVYMSVGILTGIDYCWYESSYMFPLGMLFAMYKDRVFDFYKKGKNWILLVSLMILVVSFIPYYFFGGVFTEILFIAGMIQFVLCVCSKTQGTFSPTIWLGTISLELYLVHSAILHTIDTCLDYQESIFTLVLFLVIAVLFSYLVNVLSKIIKNKFKL